MSVCEGNKNIDKGGPYLMDEWDCSLQAYGWKKCQSNIGKWSWGQNCSQSFWETTSFSTVKETPGSLSHGTEH